MLCCDESSWLPILEPSSVQVTVSLLSISRLLFDHLILYSSDFAMIDSIFSSLNSYFRREAKEEQLDEMEQLLDQINPPQDYGRTIEGALQFALFEEKIPEESAEKVLDLIKKGITSCDTIEQMWIENKLVTHRCNSIDSECKRLAFFQLRDIFFCSRKTKLFKYYFDNIVAQNPTSISKIDYLLYKAINHCDLEIFKYINFSPLTDLTCSSYIPEMLYYACKADQQGMLEALVKRKDLNINLLLSVSGDTVIPRETGKTILYLACEEKWTPETVRILLSSSYIDPNLGWVHLNETPIIKSLKECDFQRIQQFLDSTNIKIHYPLQWLSKNLSPREIISEEIAVKWSEILSKMIRDPRSHPFQDNFGEEIFANLLSKGWIEAALIHLKALSGIEAYKQVHDERLYSLCVRIDEVAKKLSDDLSYRTIFTRFKIHFHSFDTLILHYIRVTTSGGDCRGGDRIIGEIAAYTQFQFNSDEMISSHLTVKRDCYMSLEEELKKQKRLFVNALGALYRFSLSFGKNQKLHLYLKNLMEEIEKDCKTAESTYSARIFFEFKKILAMGELEFDEMDHLFPGPKKWKQWFLDRSSKISA
jgi:hypothetical protein